MPSLTTTSDGTRLGICWDDGSRSEFHAIWLRDNCRCEQCGDPAIGRRTLRLSGLDLGVTISRAGLKHVTDDACFSIDWSDGHRSKYDLGWLEGHRYDDSARASRRQSPSLWDREFLRQPPDFDFNRVTEKGQCFFELLQTIRDYGFALVSGAPAVPGTLEPFAQRIGYIQENNFGRVQDLVVDPAKRSIANDVHELKPHTDEPYRASPPGIILFHCIETDVTGGGCSTFLDAFEAAETLRREDAGGFDALVRNRQGFRRFFDGEVDLVAEFPLISVNEWGDVCGVRVNDRVHSPTCISPDEIPVYYRGLKRFLQLVEDEERILKKVLRPGDIAIFDNHRILHGRSNLTVNGRRWLQWVQVERGDFHSTFRITADRLGIGRDALPLLRGAYS